MLVVLPVRLAVLMLQLLLLSSYTTAVASTHGLLTLDSFVARFQPGLRVAKDLTEVNLENLTEFVITENPAWRVGGGGGGKVKGG